MEYGPWFDSHVHLQDKRYREDLEAVLERASEAGVVGCVCIGAGYGIAGNERALAIAAAHERVWATVGVHPHDAEHWEAGTRERLRAWLAAGAVALGECGLDYHYGDRGPDPELQRTVFAAQCELAIELGVPLVVHTRDAFADTLAILREFEIGRRVPGVMHFFTGGREEAETWLEQGLLLGIPGVVTLPNAPELRDAVPHLPLERLLVETDGPYAAPVPRRGRRNEPAYVAYVGAEVAALQGREPAEVARVTTVNALRFYGLEGAIATSGR